MTAPRLWHTKLTARLRAPAAEAERANLAFRRLLENAQDSAQERFIQAADDWAAAADRPRWPTENAGEASSLSRWGWADWGQNPVLLHPLAKEQVELPPFDLTTLERQGLEHLVRVLEAVVPKGETQADDLRKAVLALWRFAPELAAGANHDPLALAWPLLPADPRVPDHSIWDHLDLTSAFAGAMAADPEGGPALLALSIGPVQGFIAAARSTSDLWAGSHLLSRLAWEVMRPICEQLGPDAILFPRLRGIPQVDLWLKQQGLPEALFNNAPWKMAGSSDANPLFAAALPNRFIAVVPASQARALAEACTQAVRTWLMQLGEKVVRRLLEAAGFGAEAESVPLAQLRAQLKNFPEVYWAAVPFSLIKPKPDSTPRALDTSELLEAMAPFFGVKPGEPCGFLASPAWKRLEKEIHWPNGTPFYVPSPGVLYPAVYDLAERVVAAAKAARPFATDPQEGWRDSLTGEAEWLTTDRAHLKLPSGSRKDTLWARLAEKKSSWAKEGEHLNALSAIKRLWPTLFTEEISQATGKSFQRFVVTTHTMALAHQLDQWLEGGGLTAPPLSARLEKVEKASSVALPRRLIRRHPNHPALGDARRILSLLDQAREEKTLIQTQEDIRQTFARALGQDASLESYYAMLLMDGDKMGAILSGDEETGTAIAYAESVHPQVRKPFEPLAHRHAPLMDYAQQKRAISPNRHLAISGALNDFSQIVVPHVVEQEHFGRVIYAGGDDVMAMLPVADLLLCMQRLRQVYSGTIPGQEELAWQDVHAKRDALFCKSGFAFLNGRLMRMMGPNATASCGAVVAHHQAPLSAVLRELRETEKRAKNEGGRDAFALTIIKRSGGALRLTAKWGEPLELLNDLRRFLKDDGTSRRAVYHTLQWLEDLPEPKDQPQMLESLLAYQLARQSGNDPRAATLAARLTALAQAQNQGREWLMNFLTVAEFLAREVRYKGEDA